MKDDSIYLNDDLVIPLHKSLARTFGVPKALILQQIRFWMKNHRLSEQDLPESHRRHYHQDRWWIWNTYENWRNEHFDFMGERTIQRHILQLERKRVLLAGQFNRRAGDRTKWYTIDFDRMDWLVGLYNGWHTVRVIEDPSRQVGTMVMPLWRDDMAPTWHHGHATLARPLPKIFYKEKENGQGFIPERGHWQQALQELELQLARETFDTWLRGAALLGCDGQMYVIGVHNDHAQPWLDQRLRPVIERTLSRIVGQAVGVTFEVKR